MANCKSTTPLQILVPSCWAATAVIVPLALGLAVATLAAYGDWVFVGATGHASLLGFFLTSGVLFAAGAGLVVTLCFVVLDFVRRRTGAVGLAAVLTALTGIWMYKMLWMVSVSFSSSPYTDPLTVAGIGASVLLVATLARGERPWRGADVLAIAVACAFLAVTVAWLNLFYLRKADLLWGRVLNISVVLAAYALAWVGVWYGRVFWSKSVWSFSRLGKGTGRFAALVLSCGIAVVPLYTSARAAGEPSAVAGWLPPLGVPTPEVANDPPEVSVRNVILISIDTLRADHLGIYGYKRNTSPYIDRFFRDGLVFERAYSQAPWTLPSHASMFTGLHPSTHASTTFPTETFGYVDRLRSSLTTIAEVLQEEGFETAAFTGGVFLTPAYGFDQGFDRFEVAESTRMQEVLDLALPWLKSARDRRFFLFLHAFDVHRYDPAHYFKDLPDDGYTGPLREVRRSNPRLLENAVIADGLSNPTREDIAFVQHLYDTEIRLVDEQLQRLFVSLEEIGIRQETAVILTSDHGENFWERGDSGHGFTLSNSTLHVPLLMSMPGPRRAQRLTGLARVIDIPVTILESTGASSAARGRMQGMSLIRQANGAPGSETVIAEADRLGTQASIFSDDYKYTFYGIPTDNVMQGRFALLTLRGLFSRFNRSEELFDLQVDPLAQNNLANQDVERTRSLRRELFERISALRAERGYTEVSDTELSPEQLNKLRSLGYIR